MKRERELKSKIDYTKGQINKLEILSNEHGSILLLAFDKDVELGTHTAPCDVMIQIVDGECDFTLEGNPMLLKEGDFLVMRPGVQHSLMARKKFKVLLTKLGAPGDALPGPVIQH